MFSTVIAGPKLVLVGVFLGGCLTGASLLTLGGQRSAASSGVQIPADMKHGAPLESTSSHRTELDSATPADHPALLPTPPEPSGHDPLDSDIESGSSAADVLVRLEQAYQNLLAAKAPGNSDASGENAQQVPVAAVAEPAAETPEPAEQALSQRPNDVHVTVTLNSPAPAAEAADGARPEPRDAVGGPKQVQVQQVAVVNYQPVVVLPREPSQPAAPSVALGGASVSITRGLEGDGKNPWGTSRLGPRHNPWAATRMDTRHDPFSTTSPLDARHNPWGPPMGRRP